MTGPESTTYDRLKREWKRCHGIALRFYNVAHSGYPDFILVHERLRQPAFTEVKTCPTSATTVGLSTHQQILGSALILSGASVFLLAWCISDQTWGAISLTSYRDPLKFSAIQRKTHALCPELFFE